MKTESSSTAARIALGAHVTLHYRVAAVVDGVERELMNTFTAQPATLQIGQGQLAENLEQRLLGLGEGAQAHFELAAAEAFGERNPTLVQTLTRATFNANAQIDPDAPYQPGDVVQFSAPEGQRFGGVLKELNQDRVVVDFNHPLAGWPVRFAVHVIGIL
jgi:FKBP-type peptidyl-prolyl cis-trans isomerase SlpA